MTGAANSSSTRLKCSSFPEHRRKAPEARPANRTQYVKVVNEKERGRMNIVGKRKLPGSGSLTIRRSRCRQTERSDYSKAKTPCPLFTTLNAIEAAANQLSPANAGLERSPSTWERRLLTTKLKKNARLAAWTTSCMTVDDACRTSFDHLRHRRRQKSPELAFPGVATSDRRPSRRRLR